MTNTTSRKPERNDSRSLGEQERPENFRSEEQSLHDSSTFEYRPSNELYLPKDVKKLFADKGYSLRWGRYTLAGKDDLSNLRELKARGYTPVQATELPEDFASELEVVDTDRMKGLIVVGDVALFKAPTNVVEKVQEYFHNKANAQVEAVESRLKENIGGSVLNSSRSQVVKGKQTVKFDD